MDALKLDHVRQLIREEMDALELDHVRHLIREEMDRRAAVREKLIAEVLKKFHISNFVGLPHDAYLAEIVRELAHTLGAA